MRPRKSPFTISEAGEFFDFGRIDWDVAAGSWGTVDLDPSHDAEQERRHARPANVAAVLQLLSARLRTEDSTKERLQGLHA